MALLDYAINEKFYRVEGGRGICPLFSSPHRGDLTAQEFPPPGICHSKPKKMLMPGVHFCRWPEEKGHDIDSIYLKLWERNHCNHRDYQNVARNGAASFDANLLVKSMARDQKRDQPALVFSALFGNDVCTCEADLHNMTTPEEMHKNVMETLRGLDKRLPNGSHVILLSLADGRFIYETVHKHIHPVGELRGDLTYENLFNFLNCLQISPCFGWLNSNATIRNETSERAARLSEVLKFVAKTTKFENLDVNFLNLSLEELIEVNIEMF